MINQLNHSMTPLFLTLENNRNLKIVPETRVFMDGHPILSYKYSIFQDGQKTIAGNEVLKYSKATDPDYLGVITFEDPGHVFTYSAGDGRTLNPDEVEELIEQISHIRDNPDLWKSIDSL